MVPARFVRDLKAPMSLSEFAAWLGVDHRVVRDWLRKQGVILAKGEKLDATEWAGKLCPETKATEQALAMIEHPRLGLDVCMRRLVSAREASRALGMTDDHLRRIAPRGRLGTRVLVPLNWVVVQADPERRKELPQILYSKAA